MLDIMYDLPDQGRGSRYTITKDVVEGRKHMFPIAELEKQKRVTFQARSP